MWTIGKEVNATTKGSICAEREIVRSDVRCKAGAENGKENTEPGAFKSAQQYGNLLTMGGPQDLLYVGDEHRVQEFDTGGRWKREILLASISSRQASSVAALAVDKGGDVYLVYKAISSESGEHTSVVRKFNPNGDQVAQFTVYPRRPNATIHIDGLAIDPTGLIAVIGVETSPGLHMRFGSLYEADTGRLAGEFIPPSDNDGLTFNSNGDLYVAATDDQEVVVYVPASVPELVTDIMPCEIVQGNDPIAAFNCDLNGAV